VRIRDIDTVTRDDLSRELRERGVVVLRQVTLPASFEPRVADVRFRAIPDGCEVDFDGPVAYRGRHLQLARWYAQQSLPGGPGPLLRVRGDFVSALVALERRLESARDERDDAAPILPERTQETIAAEPPVARRAAVVVTPREYAGFRLRDLVAEHGSEPRGLCGRDEILAAIETSLLRETKPGVVLTGAPGVGKTEIAGLLAERIALDRVPLALRGTPVFALPPSLLIERYARQGGAANIIEPLVEATTANGRRPIFFIDELHELARPELTGLIDQLGPALASGRIRVLGTTTSDGWRRVRSAALRRRFVEIRVPEPTLEETFVMLARRVASLETHHGITIEPMIVREAILLADRFVPSRSFPDKAIDLLDHAAAVESARGDPDGSDRRSEAPEPDAPRSESSSPVPQGAAAVSHPSAESAGRRLSRDRLLDVVAHEAGVARELVDPGDGTALAATVSDALRRRLVGQTDAIDSVIATLGSRLALRSLGWSESVRTLRRDDDRRPLACFLACGPTGVGKTETARILASALFRGSLIALNGSDVGPEAPHGVAMWTGSPPGYVGSQDGGLLTDGLRRTPAAVILVDEIEKASSDAIQNILLPLLGEGVVVDRNTGESLSAKQCVIFATSNIPIDDVAAIAGRGFARASEGDVIGDREIFDALAAYLRPETIGRFHAVVRFRPLDRAARREIWQGLLRDLESRIGAGTRITLSSKAECAVEDQVAALATGARGIQDIFSRLVVPVVVAIRAGETVEIGIREGRFSIDRPAVPTDLSPGLSGVEAR
jgi:ATP-dependent Clp protease ATP-binding subunit ClpC